MLLPGAAAMNHPLAGISVFSDSLHRGRRAPEVAILGGGVAGLSAAHELCERGFSVSVYEAAAGPGGKARSIFVPGTGRDGRRDLPGEHGFRFFPSFYRHLPDTMKRIPFARNRNGVFDNLIATSRTRIARIDAPPVDVITRFPQSRADMAQLVRTIAFDDIGLPTSDVAHVAGVFLALLSTCAERRMAEHETTRWWDFIGADRRSPIFRQYFGEIAVRSLVAMCPRQASTRTVGGIGLQLWLDHARPGAEVDRLLNGPTHDAWIGPWVDHLIQRGVKFRWGARATGINCHVGRVTDVSIQTPEGPAQIAADHYVGALPVECMRPLITDAMSNADPQLAGLGALATEWMTGAQFFLDRPLPLVRGHLVLADAPWAVTAIAQAQFWPHTRLQDFGDGRVREVLSAIIANWDLPGTYVKKAARDCSLEELREELWCQIETHLNQGPAMRGGRLRRRDVVAFSLADSIEMRDGRPHNREPLFINTAGSWRHRPTAVTGIENFFLAADYVRTNTDLATMESANEAARRAVNGILDASESTAAPCEIWELREPRMFAPLRELDRQLWRRGRPHPLAALL
jgi:15-cis-phytoene desaturase